MAKIIKMKDLLKKEGIELGKVYTAKDNPPFKVEEAKLTERNEIDINQESPCWFAANANKIATVITKIANTLYSALRKAIAPSAMLLPIFFILSEPSSCFSIQLVFQKENNIAKIPEPNT